MFHFTPFEKAFLTIGPVSFKYYGLMYVLGALFVYFFLKSRFKKDNVKITAEQLLDLITWGIFGLILGARLGYVLFYNFSYYFQNPLKLFAVWEGGMSFHGGMLGAIFAGWLFCRKYKFNFYELADIVMIPIFVALAFGRLGNFINGELVGRVTTLPWGMEFDGYVGKRHPSQLYESAKNLLIFGTLLSIPKNRFAPGTIFWLSLTLYGFFRFLIEFVREPDPQIGLIFGSLTLGQILCSLMFLTGATMLIYLNRHHDSHNRL